MGAFLEKPITDKTSDVGEGAGLKYAVVGMQGWRVSMEDAHVAITAVPELDGYSFFGVFDGHAGHLAAAQSAEGLLKSIVPAIKEAAGGAPPEPAAVQAGMTKGFISFDINLRESVTDQSGTTAVTAFVTPSHYIIANCGDSRCVLAGASREMFASVDHKPSAEPETSRIHAAGGFVAMGRVNGTLAVSRALGDFVFKADATKTGPEQVVSCEPTCTILERRADDDFLILCCDGVWDVMSSADVVTFCREKYAEFSGDLNAVAQKLLDDCLSLGSRDNMTACIVALPGASTGGVAAAGSASVAGSGAATGEDPVAP